MKNYTSKIGCLIYILILVSIIGLPLYLTLSTSFKSSQEIYINYLGLPEHFSLENYIFIVTQKDFFRYCANSIYVTSASILLINIVTPLTSFIIAKNYGRKLYKYIYVFFLLPIFIPFNVVVFPLTKLLYSVHLMNSTGLILCNVALSIPENVFLYVAYFRIVNRDIFETAQLDGCTPLQYYVKILLPICQTIILTVNILNIIWIWNDFFLPLMVVNSDPALWTLPIFIYHFKGQYSFSVNLACAAYQLSIIPVAILFLVFQNKIITGATLQTRKEDRLYNPA